MGTGFVLRLWRSRGQRCCSAARHRPEMPPEMPRLLGCVGALDPEPRPDRAHRARDAARAQAVDADDRRARHLVVPLHPRLRPVARRAHQAVDGVHYDSFIVPGLITMAMVQAAYSNNSSSVFQARSDRYIHDVLAAPMRTWEVNLGLSLGGVVRALLIGVSLAGDRAGRVDRHPDPRAARARGRRRARADRSSPRSAWSSGSTPRRSDHHTFVNNILILPLTLPRRRLLLRRRARLAVAGDQPPQPDLLPRAGGPLRLPRDERRERRAGARRDGGARGGRRSLELVALRDRAPSQAVRRGGRRPRPARRARPQRRRRRSSSARRWRRRCSTTSARPGASLLRLGFAALILIALSGARGPRRAARRPAARGAVRPRRSA